MMNEIERAELEAENDGYSNEYQRAAAWSHMQPVDDDAAYLTRLLAEGRHVFVEYAPRHCKITDAVIGETVHVVGHGADREEVRLKLAESEYTFDPDCRYVILPLETTPAPAPAPTANPESDEVPF